MPRSEAPLKTPTVRAAGLVGDGNYIICGEPVRELTFYDKVSSRNKSLGSPLIVAKASLHPLGPSRERMDGDKRGLWTAFRAG